MKAKRTSLIVICVTLALVVLVALLGIFGMNIGSTKYRFMSLSEKISLGLDLRGGIYAVYQGDTSAENFDTKMDSTVTIMRNRLTNEGYTEANITRQGEDRIHILAYIRYLYLLVKMEMGMPELREIRIRKALDRLALLSERVDGLGI